MSSKFIIDSMLPKYHTQYSQNLFSNHSSPTPADTTAAVNYSLANNNNSSSSSSSPPPSIVSPASRMYPYINHQSHHQAAAAALSGQMGFSSPSSAALAAVVDAANTAVDKSCRYPSNVPSADLNYTLHHHQNGAASAASSVSAASASMAAAAHFYHNQINAAAVASATDPLNSCGTQVSATSGQSMPDIPRYPWMSITDWMSPFDRVVCGVSLHQRLLSIHQACLLVDQLFLAYRC
ncbi:hypothetical protein M8J77_015710 [Diaphorina citri]|nr:hypothetical protein M8J77_015710 [Diaphorina citri]